MNKSLFAIALSAALFAASAARAQQNPPAPQFNDEQNWAMSLQSQISADELAKAAFNADKSNTPDPLMDLAAKHNITPPAWLKARIAAQGSSTVLAAMGDSVTAAMTTCSFPFYWCPDNSWSSGGLPASVRTELAAQSGKEVKYFLVAVPGVTMSFMPAEAYAIFLASMFGLHIERMTLLIGHNDPGVCGAPAADETQKFGDDYAKTLRILAHVAQKRGARLFVSSITEVPTLARYADVTPIGAKNTCRQLWASTGRCTALLGAGAAPDAGAKISAQIATYDAILEKLSAGYGWARYADIVNASSRAGLADPARSLSSYDCFHPSVYGQGVLGQQTWSGYGATPGIAGFFAFPKSSEPAPRSAPALFPNVAAELKDGNVDFDRP
jgi:hypothetical protein